MQPERIRILIVDDLQENLDALEALLESDDVETVRAQSGRTALELLLEGDFALALLDVQMPEMDGFELAELMRGTERTRRIPIIFLTAVATDERRRFQGYEMGAVDYLLKPLDTMILRNKVEMFVELYRQRREISRHRDELAGALAKLRAHSDNSPLGLIELDSDLRIINWSMSAERLLNRTADDIVGTCFTSLLAEVPAQHELVAATVRQMIAGQRQRDMLDLTLTTHDGSMIDAECYCSALLDAFGRLQSISMQLLDVTERKRAEETQHLLVGELNHRIKNTLATVQAIATQTLKNSSGPSEFAPTFIGRVHALSSAHALLSATVWEGASLSQIVDSQLDIGVLGQDRLRASGPDIQLPPEPALHLAMVFHELVTNATKYGALSVDSGRIDFNWRVSGESLVLEWKETGGPLVEIPSRQGFGTNLIRRSLTGEGGQAEVHFERDGLRCVLEIPEKSFGISKRRAPPNATDGGGQAGGLCSDPGAGLANKRVLVVEDEPLVGLDIVSLFEELGSQAIGPITSCDAALEAIGSGTVDFALLDGNLQGEPVEDIARALHERDIPFVFVSGYGRDHLPEGYDHVAIVQKPFNAMQLIRAAEDMLNTRMPAA